MSSKSPLLFLLRMRRHHHRPHTLTLFSSTSSFHTDSSYYLTQFLPLFNRTTNFNPLTFITPRERRIIALGLSTIIKNRQGFVLKAFSIRFCSYFLVKIMKLLHTREASFAFFKLAFGNSDSDEILHSCCISAHVLSAQSRSLLAQDMVSWVFGRIEAERSKELVGFMWKNHAQYESDFSVLNTLMRGFLNGR
ncbi:uncharacterized protein LOC127126332 isoform X2 [Lathyrus oleraceus]|uniref:uncharacterized protein LOC127126332 isoform X2 n=1 Tax=Pisum sativum TaxID=3888 RepID=UPI0021D1A2C0|nr:uncharacterized protein LOC127126332 isoform X2 [Pisum sativum]